jgi:preprotein translocase subunit SecF
VLNIIQKRYFFFGLSLLVIIPGLLALILWGMPLSIDFSGGSLLEVRFTSGTTPQISEVRTLYQGLGFDDALVQTSGQDTLIVRTKHMEETQKSQIMQALQAKYGDITLQRFDSVGPSIGKEVTVRAAQAVAVAAIFITIYITYAFRGVPHAFRYGVSAIIAMLHDILVVIGIEAILGKTLGWETDALFLTALMTVIGFSVHDTIVVFDRIRENANIYRRLPYETLVNHAVVQTMSRSINTQLTVMITLLALALLGGQTIRHFVVILLIGILSGTYSSIFNAAAILVVWENQEWKTWFKRKTTTTTA